MTIVSTLQSLDLLPEERALLNGDLSQLKPDQRANLIVRVCESLGLNPLTRPFEYITLNGKLTFYARKDAMEQLRRIHGVSITKLERETIDGVLVITASASDKSGRTDSSIGAVPIGSAKGEALANVYMKAETKAKRRVTLSICGLGMFDETEVAAIPGAYPVQTSQVPATRLEGSRVSDLGVAAAGESKAPVVAFAPPEPTPEPERAIYDIRPEDIVDDEGDAADRFTLTGWILAAYDLLEMTLAARIKANETYLGYPDLTHRNVRISDLAKLRQNIESSARYQNLVVK